MSQSFKLVNKDKSQVVDINGLSTFSRWCYTNQARVLVWLIRQSSEGGGGDLPDFWRYGTLGRWAGDRITLVGDYDESDLYFDAEGYKDISALVLEEYNRAAEEHGFRPEMAL